LPLMSLSQQSAILRAKPRAIQASREQRKVGQDPGSARGLTQPLVL